MKKLILTFFTFFLLLSTLKAQDQMQAPINDCQKTNREIFLQRNAELYKEYSTIDAHVAMTEVKKAFWIPGRPGVDKALFLAHGYMGTPAEMKFIAEPFIKDGWTVVGFLIPGHGSSSFVSNQYKYERWIKEMKIQLELVTDCFSEVRASGFSTGGLLLHNYVLTEKIPASLKSLHLVSPFFIQRFGGFFERILGVFVNGMSVDTAYFISRFRDLKVMTIDKQNYNQNIPIDTAFQVKELGQKVYGMKESSQEFSKIQIPVQVFLSEGDWTVDTDSTKEVMNRDYENVQLVWYEGSEPHHLMAPSVSHVAGEVQRLIFSFKQ
ncbi:MAG: alpha/beta hydrolase [Bdellovibrionales bacterium]|nr:alpha/beta hydrolase [Bdellovibrionales bacterium]